MTTSRIALVGVMIFTLASVAVTSMAALPASYNYNGKMYSIVSGNDPTMDTGNEVCARVGRSCIGYTSQGSHNVCPKFHPTARTIMTVHGSIAEFYCNGPPQKGAACEKSYNTCQVCPKCNLNVNCATRIGDQFAEMYIECGAPLKIVKKSSARSSAKPKSSKRSSVRSAARSSARSISARGRSSAGKKGYGPLPLHKTPTLDPRIGRHPGNVVCEFYQTTKSGDSVKSNKKLVTCGAYKAADHFCVTAMQSQYARAVKCEDQGIIVCTNPCTPPTYQLPIKQCAFDNDRPRGSQAKPLEFCDGTTARTASSAAAKKKAGGACKHGGECNTGKCVGIHSYNRPIEFFCSCSDTRLDTSCGK